MILQLFQIHKEKNDRSLYLLFQIFSDLLSESSWSLLISKKCSLFVFKKDQHFSALATCYLQQNENINICFLFISEIQILDWGWGCVTFCMNIKRLRPIPQRAKTFYEAGMP